MLEIIFILKNLNSPNTSDGENNQPILDAGNKMLSLMFIADDLENGSIDPVKAMDTLNKISPQMVTNMVLDVFEKYVNEKSDN